MNYHILQGDFRSGVTSKLRIKTFDLFGVRLKWLALVAETDFDFDLFLSFSLISIKICLRGVLFSFSSLSLRAWRGDVVESVNKGWANASSQLILSSYFLLRHLLMKSLDISEIAGSNITGRWLMLLMSWSSLAAGHGVYPWSIS